MDWLNPEVLLVILGVVFLLFGPKRLPELARGIGKSMREFKQGTNGIRDELNSVVSLSEEPREPVDQKSASTSESQEDSKGGVVP